MANKITKREVINMMLENEVIAGNELFSDYLTHELELLDKKASSKKATKTQVENESIKSVVIDTIAKIGKGTVTDIQNASSELGELSNQKVSALLRQLVASELVVKTVDKKKSIFSLPTEEVEG